MKITTTANEIMHFVYNDSRLDSLLESNTDYIIITFSNHFYIEFTPYIAIYNINKKSITVLHFHNSRFIKGDYSPVDLFKHLNELISCNKINDVNFYIDSYISYSFILRFIYENNYYYFTPIISEIKDNISTGYFGFFKADSRFNDHMVPIQKMLYDSYEINQISQSDRFIYESFAFINHNWKDPEYFDVDLDKNYKYSFFYNFGGKTIRPIISFISLSSDGTYNKDKHIYNTIGSRNKIYKYDFKAYHPSIICELVDYEYGEDFYSSFATNTDRSTIKKEVFRFLYGESQQISDYITDSEFAKRIQTLKLSILENIIKNKSFVFNKFIYNINYINKDFNEYNYFNYILQYLETYRNAYIFNNNKSFMSEHLFLYEFDAFKFDTQIASDSIFTLNSPYYKISKSIISPPLI